MPTIQLLHGDCLELMQAIPDHSVDMILCDPPYGQTRNQWDNPIPLDCLWVEYKRVCRKDAAIVMFGQQPFTAQLICSNIKDFKYCYTWCKHYARGFLNAKKQPLRNTEDIVVFYRKQCTYNPQMRDGKLRAKGNSSKQRGCYGKYKPVKTVNDKYYPTQLLDFPGVPVGELKHPTQKPVSLLEYLIKTYTNPDETVLDCTCGSGSTGVACVNTGRNFTGMELDAGYFEIARNRIAGAQEHMEQEQAQLRIGEV